MSSAMFYVDMQNDILLLLTLHPCIRETTCGQSHDNRAAAEGEVSDVTESVRLDAAGLSDINSRTFWSKGENHPTWR